MQSLFYLFTSSYRRRLSSDELKEKSFSSDTDKEGEEYFLASTEERVCMSVSIDMMRVENYKEAADYEDTTIVTTYSGEEIPILMSFDDFDLLIRNIRPVSPVSAIEMLKSIKKP